MDEYSIVDNLAGTDLKDRIEENRKLPDHMSITERAQYKQLGDVYDRVYNDYNQESK